MEVLAQQNQEREATGRPGPGAIHATEQPTFNTLLLHPDSADAHG